MRLPPRVFLAILSLILVGTVIWGVATGPAPLGLADIGRALWTGGGEDMATDRTIVWQIRLPRVALAILVGSGLGTAGAVLQGLFRNPLADPYLLGVSSGAALGATVALLAGFTWQVLGLGAVPLAALAGALFSLWLVYRLARVGGKLPVFTLLLAGVAVGCFLTALVSWLVFWGQEKIHHAIFWLMGGFSARDWADVALCCPYVLIGIAVCLAWAKELNLLLGGEESACQLGVNVERAKLVLVVAAALLTAASVAVGGLIGFVGLVVPHVVRLLVGPDHRVLLPGSALAGAVFLTAADVMARTVLAPAEIPLGIVTALAGGPFFMYLLRRKGALNGHA